MIPIKSSIVIIVTALAGILSACSSAQWEKQTVSLEREYNIFDTSSVTGTGLRLESYNYQPRKCIKSSDSATTGGLLSLDFINPSTVLSGERGPYRDFIKTALIRASSYNLTGMKPVSVACIVTVSGRMNYLIDNSIQLTELAKNFLQKNDIEGFYRHCGTEFVDSTLFESAFAFVVTYYMPPDEADKFSRRVKYGREIGTSDIRNFSVFNEVGNRYPSFFSTSGSSDSLFIPLEFPVASAYGQGSDNFLKTVIHSCLSSTSGRITLLHLKKWSELPDVNSYMPQRTGDRFPEEAHDRIEALAQDMRDFSLFRIKLGMHQSEKNNEIIKTLTKKINWGSFYKCRWGISNNAYIRPEQENDCKDLLQGLNKYREIENYNSLIDILKENPGLNSDSFREVRLVDRATINGDNNSESEYRFNDKTLYVDIPEKVSPGQTMDARGKLYSTDCISKDSISYLANKNGGVSSIRNDCYPVEGDWGIITRTLLFWKQPPFKKPRYRGNLEITGFSEELSDSFTITGEAVELARKDIRKFYNKYGTHYVSQVRGRRGIVYYFFTDPAKERTINVEPYGVSLSYLDKVDANLPSDKNGGCLFSLFGKLLNQKKEEPLLHPETVTGFFGSKEDFVRVFREGSESVPVELYLKPWSQYLVERGIIRIDQTIPAGLFREQNPDALEGMVVITDNNGDVYEGMMSNGLKNGYGELKTGDGARYKGGWIGDLMHGRGAYTDKDGSMYAGEFMYGYRHGTGENKDKRGNIYKGNFFKGKINGQGEMSYKDGRKYRGEFRDGEPEGYGIMFYPDGRKVEGSFKKGLYLRK